MKPMRKVVVALVVLSLVTCVSRGSSINTGPGQEDISGDEYAVYSALLDEAFAGERPGLVVIAGQTEAYNAAGDPLQRDLNFVEQRLGPLAPEMVGDYRSKNQEARPLEREFNLKSSYVLVGRKEFSGIFKDGSWKAFRRKFPGAAGYVSLSRVGFSSDMTSALVYVAHGCGELCGYGKFILLAKESGTWKIRKELPMWVS